MSADRYVFSPAPANVSPDVTTTTAEELAPKVRDEPVYTVETLLRHRHTEDGTLEFVVKWADYADPTWEPPEYIPEELVSRYAARVKRHTGRGLSDSS